MSSLKNDRFLKAARREPVDQTPVWIMRQAGRYLPEYQAVRQRAGSFMALCKTPELACEVTLQPIQRFALDAAIIFSDILTIPDAMGCKLSFIEGKGPVFANPLQAADIHRVAVPDVERLSYVYEAITLTKRALAGSVPLIGFCGSPWTLSAYTVEGGSMPGFPRVMKLLREDPILLHHLLDVLAQSVCAHLNGQIEAGADAVMIFDTWGGLLSTENYEEFSLYYVKQVIAGLSRGKALHPVPVILFTKGGKNWLPQMAASGCDVLGLDWEVSLYEAREKVGAKVALQGNLDPAVLLQSPAEIRQAIELVLKSYGGGAGHIFNLGHGITPEVNPEQVGLLVDWVHELSKPYHQHQ